MTFPSVSRKKERKKERKKKKQDKEIIFFSIPRSNRAERVFNTQVTQVQMDNEMAGFGEGPSLTITALVTSE